MQPLRPATHPAHAAQSHPAPQPHPPTAALPATRQRPAPQHLPHRHHNRPGPAHQGRGHAPAGLPATGGSHPGPRRRRPAERHPRARLPRPELVGRRDHPRQHLPHHPRRQRLGPALGLPRRALHPTRRREKLGGARTLPPRTHGTRRGPQPGAQHRTHVVRHHAPGWPSCTSRAVGGTRPPGPA